MKKKKILYLINSKANEGWAVQDWKKARSKYGILPTNPLDLNQIKDLPELIDQKAPEIIAIGGGDGSVNLVAQAILKSRTKPAVLIIPLGLGNALSYCFGVETPGKAINVLKKQPGLVEIDVLKTNLLPHPIGLFCVSVGFDARIVYDRQHGAYLGLRSYALSTLGSFFTHPEKKMNILVDHQFEVHTTAASLMISNGPVIGKNVLVAEDAKLNDNRLDCTLFPTKFSYVQNLRPPGVPQPFYSEIGKVRFKARHIRVEGEPFVQVDGDSTTQKEVTEVSLHSEKITFLRNDLKKINQPEIPFLEKKET